MPVHIAKSKCTYIYIDQTLFSYTSSNLHVYRSEEYLGIKNCCFFRELIIIAMDNNLNVILGWKTLVTDNHGIQKEKGQSAF